MATYIYYCNIHGEFEYDHSMNTKLEYCPKCKAENIESAPPKRLIGQTSFILNGSGWAKDGYKG